MSFFHGFPPDKIKCLLLNYIDSKEVINPWFVLSCKYKIAGGLFIGPKELMKNMSNLLIQHFLFYMNNGYVGLEQEYIAIIYKKYSYMFE